MIISVLPVVLRFGQWIEFAWGWRDAATADADRNASTPIKRIDGISKGSGQLMIFGDRYRQQLALATTLQRVDHAERERVIDVVSDVGVKDQRDRLVRLLGHQSRDTEAKNHERQTPAQKHHLPAGRSDAGEVWRRGGCSGGNTPQDGAWGFWIGVRALGAAGGF